MKPLAGRRVLITGSLQRTGWAIAQALAAAGAAVALHGRERTACEAQLQRLKQLGATEAHAFFADLTEPGEVAAMASEVTQRMGPIDSLVNNVGVYAPRSLDDTGPAHWRWTMSGNLDASFYSFEAFKKQLLSHPRSRLVQLGFTSCDRMRPTTEGAAYQIAKTGVHLLTLCVARSYAHRGLTANTISPGQLTSSIDLPPLVELPSGRAADPAEVGALCLRLLLPEGDSLTGTNFELSGAWSPT